MSFRISFTQFEQQLLPRFRERLSGSERVEDVHRLLGDTVRDLLRQALGDQVEIAEDCVQFAPMMRPPYRLSPQLTSSWKFDAVWRFSDLPRIVGRLAEDASGRHRRLCRRLRLTEAKIRPGHR